jgi:hypothetical protein
MASQPAISASAAKLDSLRELLSSPETKQLYLSQDQELGWHKTNGGFSRPPNYVEGIKGERGSTGRRQSNFGAVAQFQDDEKLRLLHTTSQRLQTELADTKKQIQKREKEVWWERHNPASSICISVAKPTDEVGYKHLIALYQAIKNLGSPIASRAQMLDNRVVLIKGPLKPEFQEQYRLAKANLEKLEDDDDYTWQYDCFGDRIYPDDAEIKDEWFSEVDYFGLTYLKVELETDDLVYQMLSNATWSQKETRPSMLVYRSKPV